MHWRSDVRTPRAAPMFMFREQLHRRSAQILTSRPSSASIVRIRGDGKHPAERGSSQLWSDRHTSTPSMHHPDGNTSGARHAWPSAKTWRYCSGTSWTDTPRCPSDLSCHTVTYNVIIAAGTGATPVGNVLGTTGGCWNTSDIHIRCVDPRVSLEPFTKAQRL